MKIFSFATLSGIEFNSKISWRVPKVQKVK